MLIYRLFDRNYIFFLVFCTSLFGYLLNADASGKDYWRDAGVVRIGEKKPIEATAFTLNTLDGKRVSLKDFKGKAVFLNFWATWCPPCTIEMPSIEALHKRFKDKGLIVVAINSEEGVKKVNSFIKKKGYTFLVLLDTDGRVTSDFYRAIGLPTTYLIDRQGMVVGKAEGAREWDSEESIRLIEEILKR